ncbi:phage tail tape measure protein [Denitromonas halophila]|uniref:Phage tail tape measure protein n=1 Tax=Denitromonas halophila TaxID=1629404 RepID=A0A557QJS0_9RHOO|nr:phage tail tape measure protein [Denitromonas halophila]TVO53158.1 phage tail tape measure protein [Denitromonas halophila]
MSRSLGTLTLDLIAKTGGFESGMDKAARVADKKTRQIERQAKERAKAIEKTFTTMAAGIATAWGALNLASSVKGAADLSDQLSKMSQRTGVAVQELSALNYAASLNDATLQDLGNGIKGVSNKMLAAQAGSSEAAAAFSALGISITDSAGKLRPVEAVVLDIADAFSTMEDGAGKSALANKLMEESGIRLIPTLNNGRAGLRAMRDEASLLGETLRDLAPYSVEFNDNMTRIDTQGQTLAATIALATIPALNEVAKEFLNARDQTSVFDTAASAAKTTIETLAIVGANVAFVFAGVGREVGGVAAQLSALSTLDFEAFSAIGDMMKADAEEARARLDAFEQRVMNPSAQEPTLPTQKVSAPALPNTQKKPKALNGKNAASTQDPLTDAAKAYADVMGLLDRALRDANASGLNLTATEAELARAMSDPAFLDMPETWRNAVAQQAEYTLSAEKVAAEQTRLNELIAATPTAQLDAQRDTMLFLASAFEQGRISAEQFTEAAQTSLGNIPKHTDSAGESFIDLAKLAQDAAQDMSGAFVDYLFDPFNKSLGDMLASFLKAIAKMVVQQAVLNAMKNSSAFGSLFADGGAFNQSGQISAFADGGVVNSPTLFKFASGGSFKTGLMGEAGPEAIMPLKRGPDGKLGVASSGGAGNVNVSITINEGSRDEKGSGNDSKTGRELARQIEGVVTEVIVRNKRPGGLLYN